MRSLQPLRDSLRQPLPVYVFAGSDGWLQRAALDLVREAVLEPATRAFNDASVSAADDKGGGFVQAARTVPMMAARRLVVLRQVEDASPTFLDALLDYVGAPVPSTVLVVTGERFPAATGGMDRGLRIQNAAKKSGMVLKLDGADADPAEIAQAVATSRGVRLDRDAVRLLLELDGTDLGTIAGDLEKCADYVGPGGVVTAAVVEELCVSTVEADVWGLTDAIVARDGDRALATLHRLLEDGEPGLKLLGTIVWQLRQVLALQDTVKRGLPEREAGVRMPPQKLRVVRERIEKRPLSPSAVLNEIAAVNRAMNSSRAGDRRVLEAWLLRLLVL